MPRILIVGATGYIGQNLAHVLIASGNHQVYGIARSEEKAKALSALEITPVISPDPAGAPEPFLAAIAEHKIDVVVVAGADQKVDTLREVLVQAGKQRQDALAKAGLDKKPKLGFLYTSGIWVHGSDALNPVSDLDPVGTTASANQPPELVAWRADFEKTLMTPKVAEVLDVIIVRPALVYGRGSAIWTMFFSAIREAAKSSAPSVQLPLEADSRPALVHIDDVASGLALAVEKLPDICGAGQFPFFDLAAQTESMHDVLARFALAVGYKGKVELVGPGDNKFAAAMSVSIVNRSERARTILGWQPNKPGLVDGMQVYADAFVAAL